MSGKGKKNKKRPGRGRQAPERARAESPAPSPPAATGLHFTVATGISSLPNEDHLSLANDARLLKAGLLYADRVRLVSMGTSVTLRMLRDVARSDPEYQLDFLERHFRENIARDSPEEAETVIETIRLYRPLRRGRNLTPEQLQLRLRLALQIGNIWAKFKGGWEGFARRAGIDEIQAARRSGLVDVDEFAAGQLQRGAAIAPEAADLRNEEYFKEIFAELLDMLTDAVEGVKTHPMLDPEAAGLVRLAVEAGEIRVTDTGRSRGRHGGLASDLLRRLPMFDAASVDEVLDIRRELDGPLVKFRGEVLKFSDGMRTEGWDEDFASDAEDVFVREVDPAVREIEEMVEHNDDLKTLLTRVSRMQEWGPSAGLGMLAYNLASLPELASLAVAGTVGVAAAVRNERVEHAEALREIQGHRLFFYREAGRRLAEG